MPFSIKRSQGSFGKWLIQGSGQEMISLEYFVIPENKKVSKTKPKALMEVCQGETEAN